MTLEQIKCNLMVIGSGMAGTAASVYAAARGLSVVQAGMSTSTMFAAGCFDLLAVHPLGEGRVHEDPFAALEALRKDIPEHPYARLNDEEIQAAFDEFLHFCEEAGLHMHMRPGKNMHFPTPLGTLKTTYCVPETMINGVRALEEQLPCLLVDVAGLKGYSARQIASIMGEKLNVTGVASVIFPEMENSAEVYPQQMAMALENPRVRSEFISRLREVAGEARAIGLPAMLGLYRSSEVLRDMSEQLGAAIFEIPTMPPGITGIRLKDAFDSALDKRGVKRLAQKQVLKAEMLEQGFRLEVGSQWAQHEVHAEGVILATGRFLGKGLVAEHARVRETVFGLPVTQPESRKEWHRKAFLDPRGHALNAVGLETDVDFRPLNEEKKVVSEKLFAAGSILAHQDWMRMKCGSGLAMSTAYRAVQAFHAMR